MSSAHLDPAEIVWTLETLQRRIQERFPDAHLAAFSEEVVRTGRLAQERAEKLRRPIILLRLGVTVILGAMLLLFGYLIRDAPLLLASEELGEPIQNVEAMLSSVVFLGAAAIFLFTLETRVKRRRALSAIHELRGLAHVIDMHQLNKDPKDPTREAHDTASSPPNLLTPYELSRYLDYCSELLAIVNKVGALYARRIDDPVVLAGVDSLQRLIDGLSQKIWHKMAIVDRIIASEDVRAESIRGSNG